MSSVRPCVRLCVRVSGMLFPWCLWRSLVDFRQIFVVSASRDLDEPIRFGVKRQRSGSSAEPYRAASRRLFSYENLGSTAREFSLQV